MGGRNTQVRNIGLKPQTKILVLIYAVYQTIRGLNAVINHRCNDPNGIAQQVKNQVVMACAVGQNHVVGQHTQHFDIGQRRFSWLLDAVLVVIAVHQATAAACGDCSLPDTLTYHSGI